MPRATTFHIFIHAYAECAAIIESTDIIDYNRRMLSSYRASRKPINECAFFDARAIHSRRTTRSICHDDSVIKARLKCLDVSVTCKILYATERRREKDDDKATERRRFNQRLTAIGAFVRGAFAFFMQMRRCKRLT